MSVKIFKPCEGEYFAFVQNAVIRDRIKMWKGQRPADDEKVKEIIESHSQRTHSFGVWTVCRFKTGDTTTYHLVDGQHRYSAYMEMEDTQPVMLHVYIVDSDSDIFKIFQEINKLSPVPDFYFTINKELFQETISKYIESKRRPLRRVGAPPRVSLQGAHLPLMISNLYSKELEHINPSKLETVISLLDDLLRPLTQVDVSQHSDVKQKLENILTRIHGAKLPDIRGECEAYGFYLGLLCFQPKTQVQHTEVGKLKELLKDLCEH